MEGEERVEKGEGRLDLYICPGAPEVLVTPQSNVRCGVIFMLHPTESVSVYAFSCRVT